MKETALVIMAAGIGSRFGGGIKQLAPVGPSGENRPGSSYGKGTDRLPIPGNQCR